MATFKSFEDMEVWQKARLLCTKVYSIIITTNLAKDYKLREQINGSSGSIMDISPKGLAEEEIRNLFSSLKYPTDLLVNANPSCIAFWTELILTKHCLMNYSFYVVISEK